MSTEEQHKESIDAPTPDYPEMIVSAIKSLNEKEGSNKASIIKQIESTNPDLHPANETLVSHHLDQMKASNQLNLVNNNYVLPESGTPVPARRGRGRPPKAKTPGEAPKVKASVPGRKRGRPAKVTSGEGEKSEKKSVEEGEKSGEVKRGRGRPPKVKEGDVVANAAAPVGA